MLRAVLWGALIGGITIFAQQHQYKFIHEFAKLAYVDNDTIRNVRFLFHKMNRTTGGLNVSFQITQDFTSDSVLNIEITGYQFRSNEYRMGPIHFNLGVCTALRSELFDVPNILRYSNYTKCPVRKGYYFMNKISPDAANFPPLIPGGKWMLELNFTYKGKLCTSVQWMVKVEYPPLFSRRYRK